MYFKPKDRIVHSMQLTARCFAIPVLLLIAGCSEATVIMATPASPITVPPIVAAPSKMEGCQACSGGAPVTAQDGHSGGLDTAFSAEENAAESSPCKEDLAQMREMEEFRVCSVAIHLGHPDVAMRFMDLYEQRYPVRHRGLWEALRVRALFGLGRAQEAETSAKRWEGTEVGERILRQIALQKIWAAKRQE